MTPPDQSEDPKAPRPPVVPPAAPQSAPQSKGADAAASADTPSERPTSAGSPVPGKPASSSADKPAEPDAGKPASPSANKPASPGAAKPAERDAGKQVSPSASKPAEPDADTPDAGADDPVAVLQTVVEKLATPTTKAAAAPRSGYTPRVFAFDRPPKTAPGSDSAGTSDSAGNEGTPTQDAAAPATPAPSPATSPAGQAPRATDRDNASGEKTDTAPATPAAGAAALGTVAAAGGVAGAAAAGAAAAGAKAGSGASAAAAASASAPAGQAPAAQAPASRTPSADRSKPAADAAPQPAAPKPAAKAEPEAAPTARPDAATGPAAPAASPAAAPGTPTPAQAASEAASPAQKRPAQAAPTAATPASTPPDPAPSAKPAATPARPEPVTRAEGVPAQPNPRSADPARPATVTPAQPGQAQPGQAQPAQARPTQEPERKPAPGTGAAAAGAAAAGTAAGAAAAAASAAAAPAPPVLPAPPSVPPRTPGQPSGTMPPVPGAVPPASGPGTAPAPNAGQNGFLKPLTGAIQRVAGTRWAPVRPDAPSAFPQGAAGANGPGAPAGPGGPGGPGRPGGPNGYGPNGPGTAGQGDFYGLAGDGAPSRGPRIALFSVLTAVLLFGIYVLVAWTQSDTTPNETTVAGVDVGGMTQAEAASALTEQLAPRATEPIVLTAGEGKAQLSPEPSGLAIDAEATAAELTGFSLSPARMWAHMFGGSEQELILDIDDKKFDAAVAGLEDSLAVDPVDGTVSFVDGQPAKTDAKEGSQIVASETARIITERWINEEGPFDLPVEKVDPKITQEETDAAFAVAQKVVSAPVTVSVGGQSPVLSPEVLAGLVRFEQREDELVTIVDRETAVAAIVDGTTDLLEVPDDAHFEFVGGTPTVVEGKTGTTLDPAQTGKAVRIAATTDDRETSLELVEQDPKETVDSLEKLGVKEVVSEFHTPLTDEPVRTQNLVRGAEMITGNLVKPGETFSLLEALAPITLENGYFDAGVVENGEHVEAVGGGLSQMATTTFNAGFFAGYEDVEHHAHSYWFPRYPPGREATIYVGAKDMKFTNDTPYGAVLQSYVAGGELWVKIWSTKHYRVEESNTGKTNIVPKTVIHDSSADCKPYPGGEDGFSIGITRKVYLGNELAKENSFNHSYNPDNPVVCD